jgi:hypothetical protein
MLESPVQSTCGVSWCWISPICGVVSGSAELVRRIECQPGAQVESSC